MTEKARTHNEKEKKERGIYEKWKEENLYESEKDRRMSHKN